MASRSHAWYRAKEYQVSIPVDVYISPALRCRIPALGYLDPRASEEPVVQLVSELVASNSASAPSLLNLVLEVIAVSFYVALQVPSGASRPDGQVGLKDFEEAEYQWHWILPFRTRRWQQRRPRRPVLG